MALACLAKISPIDRDTGNRVSIYIASHNDRRVTGLNGQLWEPAIVQPPALGITLWNGDFRNEVDTGGASLPINMQMVKKTWPNVDTYAWAGAPIEIYAEEPGTAWPWSLAFKGRVSGWSTKSQVKTFSASVDTEPFDKNILTETYAGTTGIEGDANLKNQVKPLAIGRPKNVEPVLINAVDSVYQFSAYGPIESVDALFERGASLGSPIADHPNYAALVAATIPEGRWASCLAQGLIRLGAPAYGVITGDIRGHKVGSSSPRLTGAIASALATIAGVSSSDLVTSSFTAMDAALPYPISLVLTEQTTWRAIVGQLALACNYQSGISLRGQYFVSKVSFSGAEALRLDAQGHADPQVKEADEMDVSPPYTKTIMGADRCWRVHTPDEIATNATLIDRGRYSGSETYREGNYVNLADGSTWLYTNPVATSGNAPPAWPLTSDAYWDNLTPPTDASAIGAATAAAVEAAYALAASKGKVWTTATMPAVADSNVGDTWIDPADGTFYERVSATGLLLGGKVVVLDGHRPFVAWKLAETQVLRDAKAAADAAYVDANATIDAVAGLADDGTITINEKITKLIPESARLEDKWGSLSEVADDLGVSTGTAGLARTAWLAMLAALSPAWNDITQDSPVVRATYDGARDAYDAALYALAQAIDAKAATLASWSGVSGTGKPQDNATVGAPSGTNVGSTPATTVEAGANAGNAGLNSDGSVKGGKVLTASLANASVVGVTSATVSSISTSSFTLQDALSLTVTPDPADPTKSAFLILVSIKGYCRSATQGLPFKVAVTNTALTNSIANPDPTNSYSALTTYETVVSGLTGATTFKLQFCLLGASTTGAVIEEATITAFELKKTLP